MSLAAEAAKRWGVPGRSTDIDELLGDDDIDAVEILTPTHLHYAHIKAALAAGKHVSVQKPITNTVDEALELGTLADEAGLTLRVSECFVHYPPLEMAKKLISEGAIGRPIGVRIRTVVGQTDSTVPGRASPRGIRLASRQTQPRWAPLRRQRAQVRHGPVARRPGHRLGPGRGSSP